MHWIHLPDTKGHFSPSSASAVGTVVYEFCREWEARGHTSTILVPRGARADYPVGEKIEVPFGFDIEGKRSRWNRRVDSFGSRFLGVRPASLRDFAPILDAISPENRAPLFLHRGSEFAAWLKKQRPHTPLGVWFHNIPKQSAREIGRNLGACDRIVCVSQNLAENIAKRAGFSLADPFWAARFRVVPNGIDADRFQPLENRAPNPRPVLIYIGRVTPVKGVHLLVEAANLLQNRGVEFELRVVGSSSSDATGDFSDYEKKVRDLATPLGDRATFSRRVSREEIVSRLQNADVMCVPSLWEEPFGLVVLEGMACGLPVVTTRRGALPEASGNSAIFFAPETPETLAQTLEPLLRNAKEREKWGAKGRQHAQSCTWARRFSDVEAMLEGLV